MEDTLYDTPASSSMTGRERVKRMLATAPAARYLPKNPALLIGAAVIGVAGFLAWRNRERIAEAARPMLDQARPVLDAAKEKGAAMCASLPWMKSETPTTSDLSTMH